MLTEKLTYVKFHLYTINLMKVGLSKYLRARKDTNCCLQVNICSLSLGLALLLNAQLGKLVMSPHFVDKAFSSPRPQII